MPNLPKLVRKFYLRITTADAALVFDSDDFNRVMDVMNDFMDDVGVEDLIEFKFWGPANSAAE